MGTVGPTGDAEHGAVRASRRQGHGGRERLPRPAPLPSRPPPVHRRPPRRRPSRLRRRPRRTRRRARAPRPRPAPEAPARRGGAGSRSAGAGPGASVPAPAPERQPSGEAPTRHGAAPRATSCAAAGLSAPRSAGGESRRATDPCVLLRKPCSRACRAPAASRSGRPRLRTHSPGDAAGSRDRRRGGRQAGRRAPRLAPPFRCGGASRPHGSVLALAAASSFTQARHTPRPRCSTTERVEPQNTQALRGLLRRIV